MARVNRGFFSSTRADYETPQSLFDQLDNVFGFGLDVCADDRNTKVPVNYLTKEDDGLAVDWSARFSDQPGLLTTNTAWMNPEYGDQVPLWTAKAIEQADKGVRTVALLGSRTDAAWFHDDVVRAEWVLFLRGRVRFLLPCTHCGKSTPKRRRPGTDMLQSMLDSGQISNNDPLWDRGTLPVCDPCAKEYLSFWFKRAANSPAMGSMLVGWGFDTHHVQMLPATSLHTLGILVQPRGWVVQNG